MDLRLFVTVFATVFVAEVFLGAALALVTSAALGVFAGQLIGARLNPQLLSRVAGIAFVAIGVWTFLRA